MGDRLGPVPTDLDDSNNSALNDSSQSQHLLDMEREWNARNQRMLFDVQHCGSGINLVHNFQPMPTVSTNRTCEVKDATDANKGTNEPVSNVTEELSMAACFDFPQSDVAGGAVEAADWTSADYIPPLDDTSEYLGTRYDSDWDNQSLWDKYEAAGMHTDDGHDLSNGNAGADVAVLADSAEDLQHVDVPDLDIWYADSAQGYIPGHDAQALKQVLDAAGDVVKCTGGSKRFLAKKAEPSEPVRRKKEEPAESEKPTVAPTACEFVVFAAFLLYVLLACIGAIRIDKIGLVGPLIPGANKPLSVEQVRKNNIENANEELSKARSLAKDGNLKDAFSAIDRSLKLNPSAQAYLERARMSLASGYIDVAIDDYNRAVEVSPTAEIVFERAMAHVAAKNPKRAISDFTFVIQSGQSKEVFRVYALRARAQAEIHHYEDAIRDYKKAVSIAPEEATIEVGGYKNEIARCRKKLGRH